MRSFIDTYHTFVVVGVDTANKAGDLLQNLDDVLVEETRMGLENFFYYYFFVFFFSILSY